jgi:hypothetical protein
MTHQYDHDIELYGKRKSGGKRKMASKRKSAKASLKFRPKSAKTCAKRHMKWSKSTKRCNKKKMM